MVDESGIASDPRIGSLVDERYRVLEAMASGSMGVVYKAERIPVGKLVAIKFLHAPFANDSEFLLRFERETRVMSKLTHPNCVSVVDFGVWDGSPYLVMEYVSGTTLRALIDNGPLPPARALALIRQIAAGLAHAHAQGVVHRDIKPANIMVSEEIGTGDHVRILDFGLARLRGAVGRDATQSNVVVGTPNYMAPEQTVGGGLIDARTDIYAAGVVLFELVSGDRPFQADDTLALLGMHRAAPIPRLAECVPDAQLPAGLQEIIDRAMAKSPGDRFQSAIELAEAIDSVAGGRVDGGELVIRRSAGMYRTTGLAPTLLDVSSAAELVVPAPRQRRGGFFGSLLLLAILVGGVGAAVWWIKIRTTTAKVAVARSAPSSEPTVTGAAGSGDRGSAPPTEPSLAPVGTVSPSAPSPGPGAASGTAGAVPGAASGSSGAPPGPPGAGSAGSGAGAGPDSATATSAAPGPPGSTAAPGPASSAGSAATPPPAGDPPGAGGSASAPAGAGSAIVATADPAAGSAATAPAAGSATPPAASPPGARPDTPDDGADIEMDPETAEDPAPPGIRPSSDEDEVANAPRTVEEVEKHVRAAPAAPASPGPASLSGAVQLIKDGKHELAIASLLSLQKKAPASAYIPFLLGNLYYDQRWWTVAMDHYAAAIKKNAKYRSNPTLNRNVIRMLVSDKTARKAQGFLKFTVGKPAVPYLRYAAKYDPNGQVRKRASWLLGSR